MLTPQQDSEQEIERLVGERGQIVRSADPEKQDDIKAFASTLVDQEFVPYGRKYMDRRTSRTAVHEPAGGGSWIACFRCGAFHFHPSGGTCAGYPRAYRRWLGVW